MVILNATHIYKRKIYSCEKKPPYSNPKETLGNRERIGSNPVVKDKTVHIHWGELWDLTASAMGGKEIDVAILVSAKSLLHAETEKVSIGDPTGNRTPITALKRRCPSR